MFVQTWWRRHRVNWAHALALASFCQHDGNPHAWAWDYGALDQLIATTNATVVGSRDYPGYMTPLGDVQQCERCGMRRLVNEPTR